MIISFSTLRGSGMIALRFGSLGHAGHRLGTPAGALVSTCAVPAA
ncbi:hypothetical protein ACQEVF_13135 [Nonomuraea polychroma]